MEEGMSLSFEGIEPDQYGRYMIPYKSEILEEEIPLTIPTENGEIEDWQLIIADQFCESFLLIVK
jgi:hypothetical protein